ncbi:MAG TPA: hypothetical protein VF006_27240 [Longimicrobium sp.]
MTRGVAGARRLREKRSPTRRTRGIAAAAILLALAGAAGDCAGRAQEPGALAAAEVGR